MAYIAYQSRFPGYVWSASRGIQPVLLILHPEGCPLFDPCWRYWMVGRLWIISGLSSFLVLLIHLSLFSARQSWILSRTRGRPTTSRVTRARAWTQWETGCTVLN